MSKLENLTIEEVSLVDEGANPEAKILFYKSKKQPEKPPEVDELAAVVKRLETEVAKQTEILKRREFEQIAAKYELAGENAQELAKTLQKAKDAGEETYNYIIKLLDDKLKAAEASKTFEELGKSGAGVADSPRAQIEKIAQDLMSKDPTLPYRKAIEKAFQSRPDIRF